MPKAKRKTTKRKTKTKKVIRPKTKKKAEPKKPPQIFATPCYVTPGITILLHFMSTDPNENPQPALDEVCGALREQLAAAVETTAMTFKNSKIPFRDYNIVIRATTNRQESGAPNEPVANKAS